MKPTVFFSFSLLFACSADDGTDSTADSGETGVVDTAPPADPVTMKAFFEDGLTGAALKKADVCIEQPVVEGDNCFQTTNRGILNWTWEEPKKSNFIITFALENYMDTVFSGRYAEDIAAMWDEEIAQLGYVELVYSTFKRSDVQGVLDTDGITMDSSKGHILLNLVTPNGFPVSNVKVSLSDTDGNSVGKVNYFNSTMSGLDSSLKATSSTGATVITNIDPGEHVLTLDGGSRTCTPWFAWNSDEPNTTQVPVRADALTRTGLVCE
ncbi:MAG: hypothetical protein VXW32_07180 [Myxococcota bacterium]|jgi:hypothetical protein|nr:hypothetical protein [Myxococcota bacterium]